MMKTLLAFCLIGILLIMVCPVLAAPVEYTVYYVSTQGSDSNQGSIDAPFATLQKAVSAATNKPNAIIKIRGGRYPFTSTISLGSTQKGLTIEAYHDEEVVLTGAKQFPFSAFSKVTDTTVLNRIIEQTGKDNVMQVKLSDVGITDAGQIKTQGMSGGSGFAPILSWNDTLMDYAHYPNKGYVYSDKIIRAADGSVRNGSLVQCEFTIKSDRWKQWKQAEEIWSLGFLCHDWADATTPTTITANDTLTAFLSSGYPATSNRRIRFFNLLEELDIPGEYYIDRTKGILYLIPPQGILPSDLFTYTTTSTKFFNISGASNLTIKNLHLEGTLGNCITVTNSSYVDINGCEFSDMGNGVFSMGNSTYSGVQNCDFHELSSGSVAISAGNRNTLTKGNCYVKNSRFKTFSQYKRTYAPAVNLSGVGILASHNEFSDAPHSALLYGGNEHTIEYNEFFNVCNDTADSGVIYTGRDWSMWGNVIRYNYFRDLSIIDTTTGMKMQAVYLDDMHSATAVYGNVFYKTSAVGLFGGGRNNTFENNLMLECTQPFRFDSRGTTWMESGEGSTIRNNLKRMPYQTGIWAQTYPELVNILNDQPELPKYNKIQNNVMYKTAGLNLDPNVTTYGTVKDNITITSTASFQNYNSKDFNVKANSEIKQKIPNWQDIPFDEMGKKPYEDTARDEAPYVTNVSIEGSGQSGQPLTATYTLNTRGFATATPSFTWYIRENGEFRPIYNYNSATYTPTEADRGKQIRVSITPINGEGTAGEPVRTAAITVARPHANQILTASLNGTELTVQNKDTQPITVTATQADYLVVGTVKTASGITSQNKTIAPNSSVVFQIDPLKSLMVFCFDNLEPIEVQN